MSVVFNTYKESHLTRWFPLAAKPTRAGVYQTSLEQLVGIGSAYSRWNGESWENFGSWATYHNASDFVWRGVNQDPATIQ